MRPLERHHVSDQAVLVVQLLVLLGGDRCILVPAEGMQGLLHEFLGVGRVQAAIALALGDQLKGAGGEDLALGQKGLCQLTQCGIVDQFQAQQ
ncbi:hypothetical protein D3C81_1928620 [compost metagenome]